MERQNVKKKSINTTILSGIQPTGAMHIGNYLGVLKPSVEIAKNLMPEEKFMFFIADLHSITTGIVDNNLSKSIDDIFGIFYAMGFAEIENFTIYQQSQVAEHAILQWILTCNSSIGHLQRMTQFKDKSTKNNSSSNKEIPTGLLVYPNLMAADILLHDSNVVPVGDDQVQHIEYTRDLAIKFNSKYKTDFFTIPEYRLNSGGKRIKSLTNAANKMSKSDTNLKSCLYILDTKDVVVKKIMSAKMDSGTTIEYDINRPEVCNLLNIYSGFSSIDVNEVAAEFKNSGFKLFKESLIEAIWSSLSEIQAKYNHYKDSKDSDVLLYKEKLAFDLKKIQSSSAKKIAEIYKIIGFN